MIWETNASLHFNGRGCSSWQDLKTFIRDFWWSFTLSALHPWKHLFANVHADKKWWYYSLVQNSGKETWSNSWLEYPMATLYNPLGNSQVIYFISTENGIANCHPQPCAQHRSLMFPAPDGYVPACYQPCLGNMSLWYHCPDKKWNFGRIKWYLVTDYNCTTKLLWCLWQISYIFGKYTGKCKILYNIF